MRFEERELKPYAEPVLPGVYSEAQGLPEQRTTACKCLINAGNRTSGYQYRDEIAL